MTMESSNDRPMDKLILGASIASVVLSLFMVRKNSVLATFTGLWAPTILSIGGMFKENKILELEKRHALNAYLYTWAISALVRQ